MKLALCILLLLSRPWNQMHAAPMTAFPEYCHSIPASLNEEDYLLSAKIAQSILLLPTSDAQLLGAFYRACSDVPAWVLNGKVTPSALAMLQVFRDVSGRGLDPDDYPIFLIPPLGSMETTPNSVVTFTDFELQLSLGALHLAGDLRCGRIDPHALHVDLPHSCEGFRPVEFVWNLSHTQNPSIEFDFLEPTTAGYLRTKTALIKYLNFARTPQTVLSPFRGTVHPGQLSESVVALRTALTRTGDLPGVQDASNSLYDDALAAAVRSFQVRHGLMPDGLLTTETYKQLGVPMQERAEQLELTLERWRWFERSFAQPPIVVNIPEFRLRAYGSDMRVALSMKVIVGGAYHRKTPVFENQNRPSSFAHTGISLRVFSAAKSHQRCDGIRNILKNTGMNSYMNLEALFASGNGREIKMLSACSNSPYLMCMTSIFTARRHKVYLISHDVILATDASGSKIQRLLQFGS
ncbi:peptidoglycan-binding protein [Edaphobacter paludis]|uniref:Peptidoglycan-binding protein n=1 Tax=Edaphobacter paludis TaxID=3035702 RepID=A0AAU7DAN0_9BACT